MVVNVKFLEDCYSAMTRHDEEEDMTGLESLPFFSPKRRFLLVKKR